VSEAEITIPWLPLRVAAGCAASYLGCAEEDAKLRIVRKVEAGRVRARGVTSEDCPVSLLPASWRDGVVDWDAGSLKSSQLCEITNVELCFGDLVAAGLLTTTALGRAWWTAAEALAWIIMGVPLALPEWAGLPELGSGMGQAGKELARAIAEGLVQARGRHGQVKLIPGDDLRSDMIEVKAAPAGPWPRVVVTVFGTLAISPPHRGRYKGPPWESIEVDSATLRQAFPKPLRAERWPLIEAEPEPAPAVEPTPPAEPKQPAPAPSSPQSRDRAGALAFRTLGNTGAASRRRGAAKTASAAGRAPVGRVKKMATERSADVVRERNEGPSSTAGGEQKRLCASAVRPHEERFWRGHSLERADVASAAE
jgi:hypothetical protein